MSSHSPVRLVIVGGGLVGAALAARLMTGNYADAFSITLIEAVPFKSASSLDRFDPRVVALTEHSRQLFESVGIWESVARRCCPYGAMAVFDSEGTGEIRFDARDIEQANLGHIVENSILLEQLLGVIDGAPGVTMLCPEKVSALETDASGAQVLRLESGESLIADLVIAADGANSAIRAMAGLQLREWSYGQDAIVTTIETENPHDNVARQWFMADGPLAFLPLAGEPDPEGRACSIVWSQQSVEAERLMALNDADFCRELTLASERALGAVVGCDRRFRFPLRQRNAVDYFKSGIVLVGDAAHTIHPLAGQGVNLGFQDIEVLAEELERAIDIGVSVADDRVLQRYQRRRKPDNLKMMALMESFKRLFGSSSAPLRVLRNAGMSRLNDLSPVKNEIVREAMGISGRR